MGTSLRQPGVPRTGLSVSFSANQLTGIAEVCIPLSAKLQFRVFGVSVWLRLFCVWCCVRVGAAGARRFDTSGRRRCTDRWHCNTRVEQ
jgi:hypothetical protein